MPGLNNGTTGLYGGSPGLNEGVLGLYSGAAGLQAGSGGAPPPPSTAGQPIGLLLALTKAS